MHAFSLFRVSSCLASVSKQTNELTQNTARTQQMHANSLLPLPLPRQPNTHYFLVQFIHIFKIHAALSHKTTTSAQTQPNVGMFIRLCFALVSVFRLTCVACARSFVLPRFFRQRNRFGDLEACLNLALALMLSLTLVFKTIRWHACMLHFLSLCLKLQTL